MVQYKDALFENTYGMEATDANKVGRCRSNR